MQTNINGKIAWAFCGLVLLLLPGCTPSENTVAAPPKMAVAPQPVAKAQPVSRVAADSLVSFNWQDEVCENTGYYNRGSYTNAQLRDTYELVSSTSNLPSTTVFELKDYRDATFIKAGRDLQHVYDSMSLRLRSLKVVPTPFWQKMKRLRILALNESYRLHHAALSGYFQPSTLLQDPTYGHCKTYGDALSTTDTLMVLNTWRKLVDAQKEDNGDPDRLEQEFAYESSSPDRMKYARITLMTFGWFNCAVKQCKYNNLDDQYRPGQQFEKLFQRITTSDCADTD